MKNSGLKSKFRKLKSEHILNFLDKKIAKITNFKFNSGTGKIQYFIGATTYRVSYKFRKRKIWIHGS